MCSDIVIDVRNIQKRYEIFDRPKDRLKQMVLPRLSRILGGRLDSISLSSGRCAI